MKHIVLAGDSIFDNAAYVGGGPDVISHLRQQMPGDWKATLKAVDGSVIRGVQKQIVALPPDTTHLVISVGGNDALGYSGLLQQKAQSVAEVLDKLASAGEEFQSQYHQMLNQALTLGLQTTICTIYYPRYEDSNLQRLTVTALTVFNDAIIREAFSAPVPLIDLRLICDKDEDYANPIEPSEAGGRKIAAAIIRLVRDYRVENRRAEVFV